MADALFEKYRSVLQNKTIGEVWLGHDAIFLECAEEGAVMRRDGLTDQLLGHYTIMIEGGWQISENGSALTGSTSARDEQKALCTRLTGQKIADAGLDGEELSVSISNGSVLTSTGDNGAPGWRIFDRRSVLGEETWIRIKDGIVLEDR